MKNAVTRFLLYIFGTSMTTKHILYYIHDDPPKKNTLRSVRLREKDLLDTCVFYKILKLKFVNYFIVEINKQFKY